MPGTQKGNVLLVGHYGTRHNELIPELSVKG